MQKYWFYIEPYTCIFVKQKEVLFYNTLNGEHLHSKNEKILKLAKALKKTDNLMIIGMSESAFTDSTISDFIKKIRDSFSGDILEQKWSINKPIQFPPVLKIRKESGYTKESWYGEKILTNLRELTFYINNSCSQNCKKCQFYSKQFIFCKKSKYRNSLPLKNVEKILMEIQGSFLSCVNITGGDIFKYQELYKLSQILKKYPFKKNYHINYLNIKRSNKNMLKILGSDNGSIKLLVHFPINNRDLYQAFRVLNDYNINVVFVVENEREIDETEEIVIKNGLKDYRIIPYYSGNNSTFFAKSIFVSLDDIKEASPNQKEIFSRMVLNPVEFGKIVVLSNGDCHANINTPRIGNIYRNNIYDVLFKELIKGQSWRKRRQFQTPCRNCVYNLLCPPITSYERVIGKANLCHIIE
ncbi:MAG: TIGR04150 pseudo-rSAM protein [Cytophagales bacterium]|nr:TIGR04150 pseudo-rSAM protein [Cytophagales bacterium]